METKRTFKNVANTIRTHRVLNRVSQTQLAHALGYKNAQYISNIERGLCAFPYDAINKTATVLNIPAFEIKASIMRDLSETIDNFIVEEDKEIQKDSEEKITFAGGII